MEWYGVLALLGLVSLSVISVYLSWIRLGTYQFIVETLSLILSFFVLWGLLSLIAKSLH